jgi:hypothetical protein
MFQAAGETAERVTFDNRHFLIEEYSGVVERRDPLV